MCQTAGEHYDRAVRSTGHHALAIRVINSRSTPNLCSVPSNLRVQQGNPAIQKVSRQSKKCVYGVFLENTAVNAKLRIKLLIFIVYFCQSDVFAMTQGFFNPLLYP